MLPIIPIKLRLEGFRRERTFQWDPETREHKKKIKMKIKSALSN